MTTLAEELEADEQQQLSQEAIWGERAQQLVDHVKAQKPPVMKLATVNVFAMRKGWERPTLGGVLKYCVENKLLVGYAAVSGPAFKIPFTPVFDVADDDAPAKREEPAAEPKVEAKPAAAAPPKPAAAAADGCLCARTAPKKNYGCPVHGGTRISKPTKETTKMAKDWITVDDAAAMLDVGPRNISKLVAKGELDGKKDDEHQGAGRKPWLVTRASVLALVEKRKGDILDEPKAKKPEKKKPEKKVELVKADKQVMRRSSSPPSRRTGKPPIVSLREDVIALVRNVERGWMTQSGAFEALREIADSL